MRKSGVLMHLSSLSSPYGIGTMGKEAREFVDFLAESGQSCWQLLPICPTSYGDSPYQSYSTYAGNPYFIDLEQLIEKGLLEREEVEKVNWGDSSTQVDYGILYENRYPLLRKAVEKFLQNPAESYGTFLEENAFWLEDFSLFMALKDAHNGETWSKWDQSLRNYEREAIEHAREVYAKDVDFWKVLQYFFFTQWKELKQYANERGISIIGDLPIYVSLDSVDVWSHPELFQLDDEKQPIEVAGCPPDGFAADGQLWGNPLYDWNYMEQNGFSWWVQRIDYLCRVYDVLRIDHFRGFDSYYAIPYGETTAKNGRWKEGPGIRLFEEVKRQIGEKNIIAEDLGYLTESVRNLLRESGFPGMKVMEFAFDSRDASGSEYLPHFYHPNCVAYAGTHDNDTILGWFSDINEEDDAYCREYLGIEKDEDLNWKMMQALWVSVADLTIVQAQDLLGLGSEARMNEPSTVGKNWKWRAESGVFTPELAKKLRRKMRLYGRLPK